MFVCFCIRRLINISIIIYLIIYIYTYFSLIKKTEENYWAEIGDDTEVGDEDVSIHSIGQEDLRQFINKCNDNTTSSSSSVNLS